MIGQNLFGTITKRKCICFMFVLYYLKVATCQLNGVKEWCGTKINSSAVVIIRVCQMNCVWIRQSCYGCKFVIGWAKTKVKAAVCKCESKLVLQIIKKKRTWTCVYSGEKSSGLCRIVKIQKSSAKRKVLRVYYKTDRWLNNG